MRICHGLLDTFPTIQLLYEFGLRMQSKADSFTSGCWFTTGSPLFSIQPLLFYKIAFCRHDRHRHYRRANSYIPYFEVWVTTTTNIYSNDTTTSMDSYDTQNNVVIIITIIMMMMITALRGAIRDFLQCPHCAAYCLEHVRSSGLGAIVCKSRATHRALITCNLQCAIVLM